MKKNERGISCGMIHPVKVGLQKDNDQELYRLKMKLLMCQTNRRLYASRLLLLCNVESELLRMGALKKPARERKRKHADTLDQRGGSRRSLKLKRVSSCDTSGF